MQIEQIFPYFVAGRSKDILGTDSNTFFSLYFLNANDRIQPGSGFLCSKNAKSCSETVCP